MILSVNIGTDDGLVLSHNKPLPKLMLTRITNKSEVSSGPQIQINGLV